MRDSGGSPLQQLDAGVVDRHATDAAMDPTEFVIHALMAQRRAFEALMEGGTGLYRLGHVKGLSKLDALVQDAHSLNARHLALLSQLIAEREVA